MPSSLSASETQFEVPWVEKYRPLTLDDVVGNEHTVGRLRIIAQEGNLPNVILAGPPGTGKTTSIGALARTMLGDAYKEAVLELNASDSRGIDVVRNKIKMFAQKKVKLPPSRHKLIILDEADSMTSAAQQALRRTMEIYSSTTRFALACNISTKIIEPIQSRCAILRFSRLSDADVLLRLQQVCSVEGVSHTSDGLASLLFTAEGDMRNALNNLQSTHAGFKHVSQETVLRVCDQPHPTVVKQVLISCIKGDIRAAMDNMKSLYDTGYAVNDIIGTVFKVCRGQLDMEEMAKLEFIKEIGRTHLRIADGCTSVLQLLGLCARLCQLSKSLGLPAKYSADAEVSSAMDTPRPTLVDGEQDELVCPALLSAHLGTLYLTNLRVVWIATDAQAPTQSMELPYSMLTDFQVSKPPKAAIRLNRSDGQPPVILEMMKTGLVSSRNILESARKVISEQSRREKGLRSRASRMGCNLGGKRLSEEEDEGDEKDHAYGQTSWGSGQPLRRRRLEGSDLDSARVEQAAVPPSLQLQPHRPSTKADEARARAALLSGNPELKGQFDDVVGRNIVTEEEFWSGRRRLLSEEMAKAKASRRGTPSEMLADVQATKVDNKRKYTLTAASIRSIFVMYPAVLRAYKAKVPDELSEHAFWTKYFQSRFHQKQLGNTVNDDGLGAGDDMFTRYAAEEQAERGTVPGSESKGLNIPQAVDPMIDLTSQWGDHHVRERDERDSKQAKKEVDAHEIISKFNRHATLVLHPPKNDGDVKLASSTGLPQDNPRAATELVELREPLPLELGKLILQNSSAYSGTTEVEGGQTATSRSTNSGPAPITHEETPRVKGEEELKSSDCCILKHSPVLSNGLTDPIQALEIINSSRAQLDMQTNMLNAAYQQTFTTSLHRHFQEVSELLRHFYAALHVWRGGGGEAILDLQGAVGEALKEKVQRLIRKLEAKHSELADERKNFPRDARGMQLSKQIKPQLDCLSHAFEQYDKLLTDMESATERGGSCVT